MHEFEFIDMTVRHKCKKCGQWFENDKLITDHCDDCREE